MTTFYHTHAGGDLIAKGEPVIFLINGSGLGASLLIGFIILTGWMIGQEARK